MNNVINEQQMFRYIAEFDVIAHKFLYDRKDKQKDRALKNEISKLRETDEKSWDIRKATEAYLTIDKVYHVPKVENEKYCNLLQAAIEKFLGQYVDIDGMEGLFASSYFNFEWMMHLEYKADKHNYSYYRDHYIHQIRNMYEMFVLLDDGKFWRRCTEIYKGKENAVAQKMRKAVSQQVETSTSTNSRLKKVVGVKDLEEFWYHYLIFASTIVTSLVHDIGYPIVYMKRTMRNLQDFLPLSHLFMNIENAMPRIKSLLIDSLLFQTVDTEEIEKRIQQDDHGAYSAIILLFQYYDNGKIFHLDPIKRMVIELAALVIYNHTLRYEVQGQRNPHRYRNVFSENPLSYLFRLCDDLQEWKRVYFEISDVGSFFVCEKCKMPMLRNLCGQESEEKRYACLCGGKGVNTNIFPYRRLLNVDPFRNLYLCTKKVEPVKEAKEEKQNEASEGLHITLECHLGALLQVVRYYPDFAASRANGINEIRAMLKDQHNFPLTYLQSFVSCNPIAIKKEILQDYIEKHSDIVGVAFSCEKYAMQGEAEGAGERKGFLQFMQDVRSQIEENAWAEKIWDSFIKYRRKRLDVQGGFSRKAETKEIILESIRFYLFLVIAGKIICAASRDECMCKEDEEDIQAVVDSLCDARAHDIASLWNIYDRATVILIADCLKMTFCSLSWEEYNSGAYESWYQFGTLSRQDLPDIINAYTKFDAYAKICANRKRQLDSGEMLFDYYSDYFFFYEMSEIEEKEKELRDKKRTPGQ